MEDKMDIVDLNEIKIFYDNLKTGDPITGELDKYFGQVIRLAESQELQINYLEKQLKGIV
jgi:hypothetical protein